MDGIIKCLMTELQARIAFLQGERKGQENLKHDLIRRIKMLEYCLKQERFANDIATSFSINDELLCRAKNYRLTQNGEDPPEFEEADDKPGLLFSSPQLYSLDASSEPTVPSDVDAYPLEMASASGWKQGRQLLKKYLMVSPPFRFTYAMKCFQV